MTLDGKTALVTGAARGIGHAHCQRLAADGANVVAVGISDPADRLKDLPGRGEKLALVCDISRPDHISTVAGAVIERFGRCDILVNAAGIFPATDLASVTIELWRQVQAVNVEAALLFAQAFAPGMKAAGWGRIVNTGSANTLLQGRDLAYMTSKGSVHALTRALANELGASGITVNAIAPSVVRPRVSSAAPGPSGRPRTRCSPGSRQCRRSSARRFPPTWATPSASWSPARRTSSPARSSTSTAD